MKKNLGNIAIYLRVANKENNKEDSFIDFQKKEILNYLKKNCKDYKIEYFIDNGYSGITHKRPGLKDMISKMNKGSFNYVVVYSLDRLYRNITDYLKISDKVNFIFVKDNIDTEKDKAFIPIMKLIDEKYIEYRKKEKSIGGE